MRLRSPTRRDSPILSNAAESVISLIPKGFAGIEAPAASTPWNITMP